MKSRIVEGINIVLVLLLWLQPVVGRPRCSLTRNFVIIYPHDSGAKPGCRPCPICPVGQGVSPQCGSQITNETRIECKQCQANKNYSDSHGIGSCKPCNECGLKNVIQPCTPYQNRICGKDCPKGYFLNDNKDCQAEATSKPTGTKPTSTAVHNMTEEQLKTQSYKATAPPAKKLSGSEVTETPDLENRNLTTLPPTTTNNSAGDEKRKEDEEQTVDQTTFIVVVALVLPFAVIASIVLTFCCLKRSRTESGGAAGETIPLSSRELDSDGSTQVEDVLDKEVAGPNVELIPADRHVSDILEPLCDDANQPMLFYVKRELDQIETVTKKTWRSVGQALIVSSTDLDLIETEYKSGGSPTETLIKKLKTRSKEPTLREFVQALVVCERHDMASYICNWPWEKLQKSKDQPSVVQPDTNLLLE